MFPFDPTSRFNFQPSQSATLLGATLGMCQRRAIRATFRAHVGANCSSYQTWRPLSSHLWSFSRPRSAGPANSTAMAAKLGPPHFRAFGVNFGVKVGAQFGVYTFSDPTLAPLGSRFGAHSSANFDNCFHATFAARLGAHSPNVDAIFGATLEPHFMA
jgi:hypothetical protein